jgi:prophage regulatory protein
MSPAKKNRRPSPSKQKPSAAERARAALDAEPPKPSDDAVPPIERRRSAAEQARPPPPQQLLTRAEMLARVALTYPTVWKMMRAGTFPRGRAIGNGRVVWVESEIEEWIDDLPLQELKPPDEPKRKQP